VAGRVDGEIIDIRLGILTSVRKHAGTVASEPKEQYLQTYHSVASRSRQGDLRRGERIRFGARDGQEVWTCMELSR